MVLAACLAAVSGNLAAAPVDTERATSRFDAIVADSLRRLHRDDPGDRARYMACGYVAPALTRADEEAAPQGDDLAFAEMLERLRGVLRRIAAGR